MSSAAVFKHKLITHDVIFYDDIYALMELNSYGAASTVRAAVSAAGELFIHLKKGEKYRYCDKYGVTRTLTLEGFNAFMLEYFDDFIYREAISYEYTKAKSEISVWHKKCLASASDFSRKLESHGTIRQSEISALFYLYTYGEYSTVLSAVQKLYKRLCAGEKYEYYDIHGNAKTLSLDEFKYFMLEYFDESLYSRTVIYTH